MARSLQGITVTTTVKGTIQNTLDGNKVAQSLQELASLSTAWGNGVTSFQADRMWVSYDRVLAAAATSVIDLYDFVGEDVGGGDGRDAAGQVMQLAEIALIFVRVTAGGKLRIGGEGSGAAWNSGFGGSDTAKAPDLGPGGEWMIKAANDGDLVVTDATNHLLKFEGVTAQVTYDVAILGRSS